MQILSCLKICNNCRKHSSSSSSSANFRQILKFIRLYSSVGKLKLVKGKNMSPVSMNMNSASNMELIARARKGIANAFERLRANGFNGSSKLERIPEADAFVPAAATTGVEKHAEEISNGTLRINKSQNPRTGEQTDVWNYTANDTGIPRISAGQYDKNGNLIENISCSAEEADVIASVKNKTIGEELDRTDAIKQYRYNDANQRVGETSMEVVKSSDGSYAVKRSIERYPDSGRPKIEEEWVGNFGHSQVEYAENGNRLSKIEERHLNTNYPSKTTELFDKESGKLVKRSVEDRRLNQCGKDLTEKAECEFDSKTGRMTKRSSTYLSSDKGVELPKTLEEFNSDGSYKKVTVWNLMQKEPRCTYEFNYETNKTILTYNNQGKKGTVEYSGIIFRDILEQQESLKKGVGQIDISILGRLK